MALQSALTGCPSLTIVQYMLPYKKMIEIREYHDRGGRSPFREWYDRLNSEAARRVTIAIYRVGLENFSNCKSV